MTRHSCSTARKLLVALVACLLVVAAPALAIDGALTFANTLTADGTLIVHFIDVGQGDATLLQGPDFTILIDAGRHDRNDVVPYLRTTGIERIDLLIGTHPHSDHIGQFRQVLAEYEVGEVWMSGDPHTTRTYERAIDAILGSSAGYYEPKAGESFQFGSARVDVLNPAELTGDFNAGSVSVRITFGDVIFVFTGDAEEETELQIVERFDDISADVLHLGHHGSRTSSSLPLLKAVRPRLAIYSAGKGNVYGHPHQEALKRLALLEIPVYGTDEYGTLRIITDGIDFTLEAERGGILIAPAVERGGCGPDQVDINTASLDELQRIRHIGPERAAELIALRPFGAVEELSAVLGIGPARLRDILAQGVACVG